MAPSGERPQPSISTAVSGRDDRANDPTRTSPPAPLPSGRGGRRPFRWHIIVFLAPAVLVYTAVMILPLFGTLTLSFFRDAAFVGFDNFRTLFGDERWAASFWNALWNNTLFFIIHMLVQNPVGLLLAALLSQGRVRFRAFYRRHLHPDHPVFVIVGLSGS